MATITESQRDRLGGRSLETALAETRRFEQDSRLLFSRQITVCHPRKWVAIRDGRVVGVSENLDDLFTYLRANGIPSAPSAIAYKEGIEG